jgi:hypothetical protein
MKYLCDVCSRLVDLVAFSIEGDALEFVCSICGGKSRGGVSLVEPPLHFPATRAAPVLEPNRSAGGRSSSGPLVRGLAPPAAAGPSLCPKCASPRQGERQACARCGLVFARFNPDDFALPAPVEAMWKDLNAHWSDLARHEAFLDACSLADLLTEAVRRYRFKAEENPADPVAARYRDQLIERLMAVASLPSREAQGTARSPRRAIGVAGFVMLGVVALALILIFQRLAAAGH